MKIQHCQSPIGWLTYTACGKHGAHQRFQPNLWCYCQNVIADAAAEGVKNDYVSKSVTSVLSVFTHLYSHEDDAAAFSIFDISL